MASFDFDRVIDRKGTSCLKYDLLTPYFPSNDMFSHWIADMDFPSPPPVVNALAKRAEHGIYGYTGYSDSYFESVLGWFQKQYGYSAKKEWLLQTPGILTAIDAIIQSETKTGDKIIIQSPVYFPFFSCIQSKQRIVIENPLRFENGKYSMDFDDLRNKLVEENVSMVILCSPHNPVGRVWDREELNQFWDICNRKDITIIADEIHCDLMLSDKNFISFMNIVGEKHDRLVVCTSASKTFNLAGLQLSNIIIPNEEKRKNILKILDSNSLYHPNCFAPIATEIAYSDPECLEWLTAVLTYIKHNYEFLKQYIQKNLPKVHVIDAEGTYLIWINFRELRIPTNEVKSILEEKAKVALNDGRMFGIGGDGFFRMNIACPRVLLQEALDHMKQAFHN